MFVLLKTLTDNIATACLCNYSFHPQEGLIYKKDDQVLVVP